MLLLIQVSPLFSTLSAISSWVGLQNVSKILAWIEKYPNIKGLFVSRYEINIPSSLQLELGGLDKYCSSMLYWTAAPVSFRLEVKEILQGTEQV